MFIKKIFKDSRKLKRIRNYALKCDLCLSFDITKFADFRRKNADVCHVIHIFFGSSLGQV